MNREGWGTLLKDTEAHSWEVCNVDHGIKDGSCLCPLCQQRHACNDGTTLWGMLPAVACDHCPGVHFFLCTSVSWL